MTNLTENGHCTASQEFFCVRRYELYQKIFILAANIPLLVTSFLGNILIIAALQKVSTCLHSASRTLFRSLEVTDLCVGLVTQPLFVSYIIITQDSERC